LLQQLAIAPLLLVVPQSFGKELIKFNKEGKNKNGSIAGAQIF
jgi:hypothetical protein